MMVGNYNLATEFPRSLWDFFDVWQGWPYAAGVLFILTCHEMGHFLAARYHGMKRILALLYPHAHLGGLSLWHDGGLH